MAKEGKPLKKPCSFLEDLLPLRTKGKGAFLKSGTEKLPKEKVLGRDIRAEIQAGKKCLQNPGK